VQGKQDRKGGNCRGPYGKGEENDFLSRKKKEKITDNNRARRAFPLEHRPEENRGGRKFSNFPLLRNGGKERKIDDLSHQGEERKKGEKRKAGVFLEMVRKGERGKWET